MKICFIHPWVKDIPSFLKVTCLQGKVDAADLEWSDTDPDILFGTEWIYYRSELFGKFRSLYGKAAIRVGFFGEAIEPDWNIFDYGIGFSDRHAGDERFIRILSPADMFTSFITGTENELRSPDDALALLERKTGFCNFLYSNPKAHPMRDRLFYEIGKYKKVDSLGKHLNNMGTPGTGYGNGHAQECKDIKSAYKFSIASENAEFSGYTSEKCFTSLLAHTVPVYWGNPHVKDDINPEAFVNVADYPTLDAVVERIREIDNDDQLWASIVSAPWRTPEQVAMQARRTEEYVVRMAALLGGELPATVASGFHPDLYREHMIASTFPMERSFRDKLAGLLRRS